MAKSFWKLGLYSSSQVTPDPVKTHVAPTLSSADAKKFGYENFCNNCYANSVLQALYFCAPFRELMLQSPDSSLAPAAPQSPTASSPISTMPLVPNRRKPERKPSTASESVLPPVTPIPSSPPSLFSALRSLFIYISTHPQQRGTVLPRAFIEKLKEVNRIFDTTTHQDAHEFSNYLLNKIVEEVEEERKIQDGSEDLSNSITTIQSQASSSGYSQHHSTLVHRLFEGVLTSETRCLTCETISSRDEAFLDLSIDIEQNSSVTACLRQFSASEMLCHKNKFFCDSCCDLQEAEKRMKIKRLPNVLALHLKRFKYQEESQRYVKLAYRVAFPFELRLFNTVDDMEDADRLYNLFGVVVHIGNGPHHGHYVSIIKTMGTWLLFDDENVSPIAESEIPKYFGDSAPSAGCAYVLYYQAADIDMGKLGLRSDQVEEFRSTTATEQQPSPIRPSELAPEDAALIPTQSSSSLEAGPPPPIYSPPSSLPQPLPIINPSAPLLRQSVSGSTTSSQSHPRSDTAPPLPGYISSPIPVPPQKVSVGDMLFRNIRKSPGTTVGGAGASSAATTTRALLARGSVLPPVPQTPTPAEDHHTQEGPVSPTRQQWMPSGGTNTRPGRSWSQTHGSTPRALPIPPRPVTSGDSESPREGDKDNERDREKDKEGGWTRWFGGGRSAEPMITVVDGDAEGSEGPEEGESSMGEAGINTGAYLNGVSNGPPVSGLKEKEGKDKSREKEKERRKGGGNWFAKPKGFRIGEKTSKSAITPDTEASPDAMTWLRTSLQLPQRRGSEPGHRQSASRLPITIVRSSPGVYQQTPASPSASKDRPSGLSTTLDKDDSNTHLHPHDHTLVNGEVSPASSSESSFGSGDPSIATQTPTVLLPPSPATATSIHRPHSYHYLAQNGDRTHHLRLNPAPLMHSSISTPPISALPNTPSSPYHHTHIYPDSPHSPEVPLTPERKKSLSSLQTLRESLDKRNEEAWDPVALRPSTVGPETGRVREKSLPFPPVPLPSPSVALRTQHHYSHSHQPQHRRQGSGPEVDELLEDAPGLASFMSANASTGSGGSNGLKRATKKLSLTTPMLGFGKRDKDKDKTKEKAAPNSFMRV